MDKLKGDSLKKHRDRLVLYLITLSLCSVWVTMGMFSAWPTVAFSYFKKNGTAVKLTMSEIGTLNSLNPVGFTVGSLATRFVADRLGRRATVLASAMPVALGSLLASFAVQAWPLYLTRFLWGFGTGMVKPVVNMYLAETSDKDIRATLSVFTRVAFNLGLLLVMTTTGVMTYESLNYTLLALPIAYFILCYWIPETPYYHLKEGRVDAARKALRQIWRNKSEKELESELKLMQSNVSSEMQHSSSVKELFSGKQYRKRIIISAVLQVTSIMTGLVSIRNYLGPIIKQSKSSLDETTVITVFGIVQFVVGIISMVIADRVGRRPQLYCSLFGTGLCLAAASVYFFFLEIIKVEDQALRPYGYVPFITITLAFVISTLGFNAIIPVIPGEIFPINVKAVALTSLSMSGGLLGFGMGKSYQEIVNWGGLFGAFCIFASFAIAGGVFVVFYVPETNGKSLEEIQIMFQGKPAKHTEAEMDTLSQGKDLESDNFVENNELTKMDLREVKT